MSTIQATGEALPLKSIFTGEPLSLATRRSLDYRSFGAAALALHVVAILGTLLVLGRIPTEMETSEVQLPTTLVFRIEPGPGGGGGGGGEESPEPPAAREIAGSDLGEIAVEPESPETLVLAEPVVESTDPEPAEETGTRIDAPLVPTAPDERDRRGVLEADPEGVGAGPGSGGGAGTGSGTGSGPGEGAGVGPGTGGGFGGGAHRLGSGVDPPVLLRSVDPVYTREALQRKLEGDVVLEIVILADGRVGDVRVLRGLEPALDLNAIAAAQQWRFRPGSIQGKPVAVIAEIVMEFRLL